MSRAQDRQSYDTSTRLRLLETDLDDMDAEMRLAFKEFKEDLKATREFQVKIYAAVIATALSLAATAIMFGLNLAVNS